MSDRYQRAREVAQAMLLPEHAAAMERPADKTRFASEFARLAFENAYAQLWARPGLGLRDRSLLTLGMLIALGNVSELKSHLVSARRNGVTLEELEEVIYHATAYVGFPTA